MKIGFIVLVFSLALLFVLLILQVIMAIKNDSFDWFLNSFQAGIIVPLVMIFGLMLLDDNGQ